MIENLVDLLGSAGWVHQELSNFNPLTTGADGKTTLKPIDPDDAVFAVNFMYVWMACVTR